MLGRGFKRAEIQTSIGPISKLSTNQMASVAILWRWIELANRSWSPTLYFPGLLRALVYTLRQ